MPAALFTLRAQGGYQAATFKGIGNQSDRQVLLPGQCLTTWESFKSMLDKCYGTASNKYRITILKGVPQGLTGIDLVPDMIAEYKLWELCTIRGPTDLPGLELGVEIVKK